MVAMGLTEDRRNRLLELTRQRSFAALPDLAEELQVSESTVRRDLDFLEESGVVKRTHGGVFYTGPSPKVAHFDHRQRSQWEKKKLIAEAAAKLIDEGDTILLDGGSTTYELARMLVGRTLQVVTNSLPVASLFLSNATADLILIGGYVHSRTGVSLGSYANHMLGELNVRRAVLSVGGITPRGYYNSNMLLVETERAMMESADEVIVLVDSSKFDRSSLALLCPLEGIDLVVVDSEISQAWRERLTDAGVKLVIATASEPAVEADQPRT